MGCKDAAGLIPLEALGEAAECLRTLAHPHRLRIVEMLLAHERHVGELVEACGISQPSCSVHLKMLRDRGLVAADRRGRRVYYRINEPGLKAIMSCVRERFHGDDRPEGCREVEGAAEVIIAADLADRALSAP